MVAGFAVVLVNRHWALASLSLFDKVKVFWNGPTTLSMAAKLREAASLPDRKYQSGEVSNMGIKLRALSRQEVRGLDTRAVTELALPTLVLMENAGRGAAALLVEAMAQTARQPPGSQGAAFDQVPGSVTPSILQTAPRVLILCGPGNNGGDGAVVARHLDAWGFPVQVIWFARQAELRGDAKVQWEILERSGVDQTAWYDTYGEPVQAGALDVVIASPDWLVDGLLGTGLMRPLEGALKHVVEAMNRSGRPILALDLPSGLDADQGVPLGTAVRARLTSTFVAPKLGFTAPGARDYTGEVIVVDIGLPRCLLRAFEE